MRATRLIRPAMRSGLVARSYAAKPASSATSPASSDASPFASAPQTEEGLREAIQRASPMMRSSGPAASLARTLFVATEIANQSTKKDNHQHVAADIAKLREVLQYPEWQTFFLSPVISNEDRESTLNELWAKIGASEITRLLFQRIVEGKNTKLVPQMVEVYDQLLRARRNEVSATVTTAQPMTASETKELQRVIAEYFADGGSAKVVLEQRVEPDILGGLKLMVGSTYVDFSVKTQIDDIEEAFLQSVNAKFERLMMRSV